MNGLKYPVHSNADTPLLFVLREEIGLTETKYGCGEGQCGACTVLIGGSPRRSCQVPVGKDPAAVQGTPEQIEKAFRDAFVTLDRRISLLLCLPLASLDKLAIKKEIDRIGHT